MRRIGISQRVDVVAAYGERRDCLDQRWAQLLEGIGWLPVPLPNTIENVDRYVAALALDGVILSGGNDLCSTPGATQCAPERDLFEGRLLDVCAGRSIPVLGVCRGMQMLVVHYGGSLARVTGHVGTRHCVAPSPDAESVWVPFSDVNTFHNYGVLPQTLGPRLRAVVLGGDGTVEAVQHAGLPQVGIMWHPERESALGDGDMALLQWVFAGRASA